MTFFSTNELNKTEMLPGLMRQAVWLENLMVTFFEFEPNAEVPEHDHPHEQITYVTSGALELTLAGEVRILRAGDGVCVPSGVRHSARTLDEPTTAVDAWNPIREEYKG
jgi:quercetin dioxygenase-like cupin family protein